MNYLKYILLIFIMPLLSTKCNEKEELIIVSAGSACTELVQLAKTGWVVDKESIFSPDYNYFCDANYLKDLKDLFNYSMECRESITLGNLEHIFGKPNEIIDGIDPSFEIYGEILEELVEEDKSYLTVKYVCLTDGKVSGEYGYCSQITSIQMFLIEKETGKHLLNVFLQGSTGWFKTK